MTAKTTAQRQAAHKSRKIAAGFVILKRWVHRDDAPKIIELAGTLERRRAKKVKKC